MLHLLYIYSDVCNVVISTVYLHSYAKWEYVTAAPGIIAGDILVVVIPALILL